MRLSKLPNALLLFCLPTFFLCSLFFFASASATPGKSGAQLPKSLRVIMDDSYPPFIFRDSSGKIQGILPDQWALWEKYTGVDVSIEATDWARAQEDFLKGEADVIDTIFFTKERSGLYDFTKPYAEIRVSIFFNQEISGIKDIPSLKGFVIGVKKGDACIEILKSKGITTFSFYPSYPAIIQAAKIGSIKVFCMDEPPAHYYLNRFKIASEFRRGPLLYVGKFHRAVRKGNVTVLKMVQQGFESVPESALSKIDSRWYGKELGVPGYYLYLKWILSGILFLMLMIIVWVFSLRRAVRERTRELETSRRKTEAALRKYTELFERVPVGLFRTTPDGRILDGNSYFAHILGYSSKEELQQVSILDHYEDLSDRKRWQEMLAREGMALDFSCRFRRCDGKLIWIENRTYTHYDENGKLKYYEGSVQDVTTRIEAEAESRLLAIAISQAEETVVITDPLAQIEYVNPAFERSTGYSRDEVIGQNPRILKSGKHSDAFYKDMWATLVSGEAWKGIFINKKKDGTLYEEQATISPVTNDDGQITHYVAVKRDVTAERNLERQLQQAQKMESLGSLAGGIAHDFNNILSAIMGYTELALVSYNDGPRVKEWMEKVFQSAERARELVKQILAFSRQSKEGLRPVSIQPILKEALGMLRASLPATIEIQQDIDPQAGIIMGDPSQVHQVVMNLCTNAAHAMRENGGILKVKLENTHLDESCAKMHQRLRPGSYVRLTVSDTGHGMPRDVLDRIFDPYFTTKEKGEGTGLGLAVVSGIVHSYNGTVLVNSTPGQGTTFDIYLPVLEGEKHPGDEKAAFSLNSFSGSGRILFVDDDEAIAEICSKMIESLGYEVTKRTSPVEALELFRIKPQSFDLVISDMTMPQMTGDELADELMRIRPDIPIVLCTGFSDRITAEEAKAKGVREFLMKPMLIKDLAITIKKVLGG